MELGIDNAKSCSERLTGQILLYDGEGKGKSQSSLGLALRMIGLGITEQKNNRVLIIRFLKGENQAYSEDIALRILQQNFPYLVSIIHLGTGKYLDNTNITNEDYIDAEVGWKIAEQFLENDTFSLIILDELNPVLNLKLLDINRVTEKLKQLKQSQRNTEVVITGINTPQSIKELSDLHSEIKPQTKNSNPQYNIENYIGDGKGKSTSAFGKILKYIGQDKKVLIVQFLKGGKGYTEDAVLKVLKESFTKKIDHFHCGRSVIVFKGKEKEEDILEAQRGWEIVKSGIYSKNYDLIMLDEINPTLDLELLDKNEVINVLQEESKNHHIITTGRAKEDLFQSNVYNVFCHKHYSEKGTFLKNGIDY